jgi:hypothetical protein
MRCEKKFTKAQRVDACIYIAGQNETHHSPYHVSSPLFLCELTLSLSVNLRKADFLQAKDFFVVVKCSLSKRLFMGLTNTKFIDWTNERMGECQFLKPKTISVPDGIKSTQIKKKYTALTYSKHTKLKRFFMLLTVIVCVCDGGMMVVVSKISASV